MLSQNELVALTDAENVESFSFFMYADKFCDRMKNSKENSNSLISQDRNFYERFHCVRKN